MKIKSWSNCPVCLGKLLEKENFKKCSVCNREFYDNPVLAAGLVIWNNQNQIMLGERKNDPGKGQYSFPGGFVDVGESVEDAIKREIKEELQINVDQFTYLTSTDNDYLYKKSQYDMLDILFEIKLSDDIIAKIEPNDDVESVQFFDLNEIKDEILAFKSTKKVVKFLRNRGVNDVD